MNSNLTKDEILRGIDFGAFYKKELGQNCKINGNGWSETILCPFHNETHPSFTFNSQNGGFKCFGCDESGDLFSFITKHQNTDFVGALKYAADFAGVQATGNNRSPNARDVVTPGKTKPDYLQERFHRSVRRSIPDDGITYLKSRGIKKMLPALQKRKLIGWDIETKTKSAGISFPIVSSDRTQLIGIQIIPIDGTGKRFVKGTRAKEGFFFADKGPPSPNEQQYVICEGIIDALSVAECGGSLPVCSILSVSNTVKLDSLNCQSLTLFLDNDEAGKKATLNAAKALEGSGKKVRMVEWTAAETAKDVNDILKTGNRELIIKMINGAKPSSRTRTPVSITAAELINKDFPEAKWAIPGILPEGLSILGGKPKHGKSILCANIGISISAGSFALGNQDLVVEKGSVIYLALEDTERRLKTRLRQMLPAQGRDFIAPSLFHFFTNFPRSNEGGRKFLRQEIEKYPDIRLVIIDTLAKFRPMNNGKNTNLYEKDYENIALIKEIADHYGVSILVVHHLRKMESEDVMDTFSGTLGLTGAADNLLALERKTGRLEAVLHVSGRDVEAAQYEMKFDSKFLSWQLLGKADEVQSTEQQQQVYDAIKRSGISSPKILQGVTKIPERQIYKILDSLTKKGKVKKVDRGQYTISDSLQEDTIVV